LFLLSLENATISAMVMIVVAVAARAFTTALLSSSKKDYDKIREQLHGARAEFGFQRERLNSARGVMSFNERQKDDLVHRIQMARDDLEVLQTEDPDLSEGKAAGEKRADPKLPRHMRPRDGNFFND
jgi:hypothetical protein